MQSVEAALATKSTRGEPPSDSGHDADQPRRRRWADIGLHEVCVDEDLRVGIDLFDVVLSVGSSPSKQPQRFEPYGFQSIANLEVVEGCIDGLRRLVECLGEDSIYIICRSNLGDLHRQTSFMSWLVDQCQLCESTGILASHILFCGELVGVDGEPDLMGQLRWICDAIGGRPSHYVSTSLRCLISLFLDLVGKDSSFADCHNGGLLLHVIPSAKQQVNVSYSEGKSAASSSPRRTESEALHMLPSRMETFYRRAECWEEIVDELEDACLCRRGIIEVTQERVPLSTAQLDQVSSTQEITRTTSGSSAGNSRGGSGGGGGTNPRGKRRGTRGGAKNRLAGTKRAAYKEASYAEAQAQAVSARRPASAPVAPIAPQLTPHFPTVVRSPVQAPAWVPEPAVEAAAEYRPRPRLQLKPRSAPLGEVGGVAKVSEKTKLLFGRVM